MLLAHIYRRSQAGQWPGVLLVDKLFCRTRKYGASHTSVAWSHALSHSKRMSVYTCENCVEWIVDYSQQQVTAALYIQIMASRCGRPTRLHAFHSSALIPSFPSQGLHSQAEASIPEPRPPSPSRGLHPRADAFILNPPFLILHSGPTLIPEVALPSDNT